MIVSNGEKAERKKGVKEIKKKREKIQKKRGETKEDTEENIQRKRRVYKNLKG